MEACRDLTRAPEDLPRHFRRRGLTVPGVSLTHVAYVRICIIINGTRVEGCGPHTRIGAERGVYLRGARAKMCNCVTHRIQLYGHGESDA